MPIKPIKTTKIKGIKRIIFPTGLKPATLGKLEGLGKNQQILKKGMKKDRMDKAAIRRANKRNLAEIEADLVERLKSGQLNAGERIFVDGRFYLLKVVNGKLDVNWEKDGTIYDMIETEKAKSVRKIAAHLGL